MTRTTGPGGIASGDGAVTSTTVHLTPFALPLRLAGAAAFASVLAVVVVGCSDRDFKSTPGSPGAEWAPPSEDSIPADSLGASIRRGLELIRNTPANLPAYATSNLRCVSCHQLDGRKATAAPLAGSFIRYPKYLPRTGAVVTIADRVNYCFTRSLAGNALPYDSREMADIVSYLAFISRGAPVGAKLPGADGLIAMKDTLTGDATRGRAVFEATCVVCHGKDGAGALGFPALWGPNSYAIGASMARQERAASFIYHNMPQNLPGSLTPQQAFDVAAYINSHERPDSPGKENDYPAGGAPRDVPYATSGRTPATPAPRMLPRANPKGATVPAPPSVRRGAQ